MKKCTILGSRLSPTLAVCTKNCAIAWKIHLLLFCIPFLMFSEQFLVSFVFSQKYFPTKSLNSRLCKSATIFVGKNHSFSFFGDLEKSPRINTLFSRVRKVNSKCSFRCFLYWSSSVDSRLLRRVFLTIVNKYVFVLFSASERRLAFYYSLKRPHLYQKFIFLCLGGCWGR